MTEAIVVALIGLAAGALGSLVAPWAQWGVEQKRERLAHRRSLVRSWREGVEKAERETRYEGPSVWYEYLTSEWYLSLRPLLRHESTGGMNADALSEEIARIERDWGLM